MKTRLELYQGSARKSKQVKRHPLSGYLQPALALRATAVPPRQGRRSKSSGNKNNSKRPGAQIEALLPSARTGRDLRFQPCSRREWENMARLGALRTESPQVLLVAASTPDETNPPICLPRPAPGAMCDPDSRPRHLSPVTFWALEPRIRPAWS